MAAYFKVNGTAIDPGFTYGLVEAALRQGDGAGLRRWTLTVNGTLASTGYNDHWTQVETLRTRFAKDYAAIVLHDGTQIRVNTVAQIDSFNIQDNKQIRWAQYTAVFSWVEQPVDSGVSGTWTLGGVTLSPQPLMARSNRNARRSDVGVIQKYRGDVSLKGWLKGSSISDLQGKIDALQLVCRGNTVSLVSPGFNRVIYLTDGFSTGDITHLKYCSYTVNGYYYETPAGQESNVVEFHNEITINQPIERYALHDVPGVDGKVSGGYNGLTPMVVVWSGSYECTSLAYAYAQINAYLTANVPAGGRVTTDQKMPDVNGYVVRYNYIVDYDEAVPMEEFGA